MNLKVANLVGIQFGIFVGLISWLAYSRLESDEPGPAPEMQRSVPAQVAPVAPVAPAREPRDQRSQTADYQADPDRAPPVIEPPVPVVHHKYSPEAVQQYTALAAQQYYQQIAPRRYASAGQDRSIAAAEAPSYAEVDPAPAVAPVEYAAEPEPAAYVQTNQVVVYPQPQFVVFSNRHRFANRCRQASHPRGPRTTFAHQRRDRGGPHLSDLKGFRPTKSFGVVHRQNGSAPSCRPTQGFASRGRR